MISVFKFGPDPFYFKRAGHFDQYRRTRIIKDHTSFPVVGLAQPTPSNCRKKAQERREREVG